MTPDADYQPSEFEKLSSYDKVTFTHTVSYEKFDTDDIYVTPDASATGKGTKDSPVSIYTAVNYAQPGQNIILAGGTYNLKSTLTIQPGVNGTEVFLILERTVKVLYWQEATGHVRILMLLIQLMARMV